MTSWFDVETAENNGTLDRIPTAKLREFSGIRMPPSQNPAFHARFRNTMEKVRFILTERQNQANPSINIHDSSNVIIGDQNTLNIQQSVASLVNIIDDSDASPEQKEEAKSLLRKFLDHPLVSALAGGAVGLLGK